MTILQAGVGMVLVYLFVDFYGYEPKMESNHQHTNTQLVLQASCPFGCQSCSKVKKAEKLKEHKNRDLRYYAVM